MAERIGIKTRSGHPVPVVGALVSWKSLVGIIQEGEVVERFHDENNGQVWIVVKGEFGVVSVTADGDFVEVVNP